MSLKFTKMLGYETSGTQKTPPCIPLPGERDSEFSLYNYNHHIVVVVVIRRQGNNVGVVCALRGGLHNAAMTGI